MPTISKRKKLARIQAARTNFVVDKASFFVSKYTSIVKRDAIKALRSGKPFRISASDIVKLTDELASLSMLAFIQEHKKQAKEVYKNRPEATLSFGFFDAAARAYSRNLNTSSGFFQSATAAQAKAFDIELDNIRGNLGTFARKKVNESVANLREGVNESLAAITSQGLPTRTNMKLLNEELEVMGVSAKKNNYVETLVRTHGMIAANAAQWNIAQQSDYIWGFTYVTVDDDRVRPEHEELDMISRPKDDNFWEIAWPPNGWNCRCQALTEYFPQPITPLPKTIDIEEEWQFNPGKLLNPKPLTYSFSF